MKIEQIRYKRAAKVSTAQFENTDIEFELVATLEEGDDPNKCMRSLRAKVDARVCDAIDDIDMDRVRVESKAGRFGVGQYRALPSFNDDDED